MNIRPTTSADYDFLVALNQKVHALHVQLRPGDFAPMSDAQIRESLVGMLSQSHFFGLIALADATPIGYALYELRQQPAREFRPARKLIHIHHMGVDEGHQRRGVGKSLISHIRQHAATLQIDVIELNFWSANAQARAFYQSLGFLPIREVVELRESTPPHGR